MTDLFHKVVLHGEILDFITTAIVANAAEVESGSTFVKFVAQLKSKIVSQNGPCYTLQRLVKLVSQRRCT